jgi:hypothetical protein
MDDGYELRNSRIIELTLDQFYNDDPDSFGFNGKTWERNIQAVVVGGVTVMDRKHSISKRGKQLFNRWLRDRFDYGL